MLSVTPKAQEKLKEILEYQGLSQASVRLQVVRGPHGCVHGWKLALDDQVNPEDTVIQAGEVRILVEPELVEMLEGASIDYREDATAIGFTIEVPNVPQHQHGGGGCHH